jgi:hypothetical protein
MIRAYAISNHDFERNREVGETYPTSLSSVNPKAMKSNGDMVSDKATHEGMRKALGDII